MSEFSVVRHKMYCDDVQLLIYMWKLGLYPVAFDSVPGRNRLGFPTYEYTTETKLPWTRNEELTLTERNRLLGTYIIFTFYLGSFCFVPIPYGLPGCLPRIASLCKDRLHEIQPYPLEKNAETFFCSKRAYCLYTDREIAHEEERLRAIMKGPPEPPVHPREPPAVSAAPSAPQALPEAVGAEIIERKTQHPTAFVSEGEAVTESSPKMEHSQMGSVKGSGSPTSGGAADSESVPWYRTLAGVAGMIIGCTILMFFCFRFCSNRRDNTPTSNLREGAAGTSSGDTNIRDKGGFQRRPAGRMEGYAQVSDEHAARDPDADSWWDQENAEAFSSS